MLGFLSCLATWLPVRVVAMCMGEDLPGETASFHLIQKTSDGPRILLVGRFLFQ